MSLKGVNVAAGFGVIVMVWVCVAVLLHPSVIVQVRVSDPPQVLAVPVCTPLTLPGGRQLSV